MRCLLQADVILLQISQDSETTLFCEYLMDRVRRLFWRRILMSQVAEDQSSCLGATGFRQICYEIGNLDSGRVRVSSEHE